MNINNKILLLDCTLRDGGFVNDWNFGHDTLINVFERLVSSKVDFIEIGFLDRRRPFDINRSIMPDTKSAGIIYSNLDKKNTEVVAMIDYGTCDLSNIQPQHETMIDGIRVIFKKDLMREALDYCREIKALGYKVFTQAVSITSYNDDELMELIKLVNEVKPFSVAIVDTYGLLHKNRLFHYYECMNAHLDKDIGIGYHSHNNFQLGYSNCIELINKHSGSERLLLLDGSVFGMGKGAGNAPTELLAMYMNDNCEKNYDISQMLEIIDVNLLDIFKQTPWGYAMKYFIAASNDCHPDYVSYLLNKKTLAVKSVNEVLKTIPNDKKLLFDKACIEQLYLDYQKDYCNDQVDYKKLSDTLKGKEILIIGPGASISTESEKIKTYINKHNPIIVAVNFIPPEYPVNYIFLTNAKRYVQQATHISRLGGQITTIATSNLTKSAGKFDYILDYESLIDREAVFMDVSFVMLLKVLINIGVQQVAAAGFDGYSTEKSTHYYSSEMEYNFVKHKEEEINRYVNKMLSEFAETMNVKFITTTLYKI